MTILKKLTKILLAAPLFMVVCAFGQGNGGAAGPRSLFVLTVGVPGKASGFSREDAEDIEAIFSKKLHYESTWQKVKTDIYRREGPTTAPRLSKLFTGLVTDAPVDSTDVMLVYISGSGFVKNGRSMLAGSDFKSTLAEKTSLDVSSEILDQLARVKCQKIIMLDVGGSDSLAYLSNSSTIIITSASSGQSPYEDDQWKNSAFAKALQEGLVNDEAFDANKDGLISLGELMAWVEKRVPELVLKFKGEKQQITWVKSNPLNSIILKEKSRPQQTQLLQ